MIFLIVIHTSIIIELKDFSKSFKKKKKKFQYKMNGLSKADYNAKCLCV